MLFAGLVFLIRILPFISAFGLFVGSILARLVLLSVFDAFGLSFIYW